MLRRDNKKENLYLIAGLFAFILLWVYHQYLLYINHNYIWPMMLPTNLSSTSALISSFTLYPNFLSWLSANISLPQETINLFIYYAAEIVKFVSIFYLGYYLVKGLEGGILAIAFFYGSYFRWITLGYDYEAWNITISLIVFSLSLPAIILWFKKREYLSSLYLGILALWQPLFPSIVFGFIFIEMLFNPIRNLKKIFGITAIYVLCISPLLINYLKTFTDSPAVADHLTTDTLSLWWDYALRIRKDVFAPWLNRFMSVQLALWIAIIGSLNLLFRGRGYQDLARKNTAVLMGIFVYFVVDFTSLYAKSFSIKILDLLRSTLYIFIFGSVSLAALIHFLFEKKDYIHRTIVIAALIPTLIFIPRLFIMHFILLAIAISILIAHFNVTFNKKWLTVFLFFIPVFSMGLAYKLRQLVSKSSPYTAWMAGLFCVSIFLFVIFLMIRNDKTKYLTKILSRKYVIIGIVLLAMVSYYNRTIYIFKEFAVYNKEGYEQLVELKDWVRGKYDSRWLVLGPMAPRKIENYIRVKPLFDHSFHHLIYSHGQIPDFDRRLRVLFNITADDYYRDTRAHDWRRLYLEFTEEDVKRVKAAFPETRYMICIKDPKCAFQYESFKTGNKKFNFPVMFQNKGYIIYSLEGS